MPKEAAPHRRIDDLLREAKEAGASDVHISPDRPPFFRIDGKLGPVGEQLLTEVETQDMIKKLIGANERADRQLSQKQQTDFSYSLPDGARFRINVFFRTGGLSAALRLIPSNIRSIEELNLPAHILQFAELKQGFVLAVGPAGHGKSTTLAALINHINQYRREHIITIEDPIEYQFKDSMSIIDQREIGRDAPSFLEAIKSTLRQDPNIILIGELREPESMSAAMTLAETGHLVFSTLHTNDAAQTVERIIDSFPAGQQSQIRSQLSAALSGVISQRLLPQKESGRVPAVEIMLASPAIRTTIREDNIHQILGIIQTSSELGMQTLDASLQSLIDSGLISREAAAPYFTSPP
ncbi:MAG: PilT/PilU family type 4a pilus ATPase [bacterium]